MWRTWRLAGCTIVLMAAAFLHSLEATVLAAAPAQLVLKLRLSSTQPLPVATGAALATEAEAIWRQHH